MSTLFSDALDQIERELDAAREAQNPAALADLPIRRQGLTLARDDAQQVADAQQAAAVAQQVAAERAAGIAAAGELARAAAEQAQTLTRDYIRVRARLDKDVQALRRLVTAWQAQHADWIALAGALGAPGMHRRAVRSEAEEAADLGILAELDAAGVDVAALRLAYRPTSHTDTAWPSPFPQDDAIGYALIRLVNEG